MTKRKNRKKASKSLALLVSVIVLLCATFGGTMAYLMKETGEVSNTFTPSYVATAVKETLNNNTKSDVCIQNTGNTDAYIRAAVVVSWKNENGQVYGTPVKATDYNIAMGTGWTKATDGYYYWPNAVSKDDVTGDLIESCALATGVTPPEGYSLNVEILASGIQSKPDNAFNTSWASSGLTANNGILTSNASN